MNDHEKVYNSIIDVMNDPLFSEADAKLRAGINIIPEDDTLHSFVHCSYEYLRDYFAKVYMTLRCSPEQVYYNQMQRRTGVPYRKMDELSMVIGLTMVSINLDTLSVVSNSNWIGIDQLINQLMDKLSEERMRELFGSKRAGVATQYDLTKIREEVKKRMRDLQRKNFIRINVENNCYMPTLAIYRFIDPLRDISVKDEIPIHVHNLIMEGYLVKEDACIKEDSDPLEDGSHWTENIGNDPLVNMDLFDNCGDIKNE